MLGPSYPLMVTVLVPGRDDLREILDILHVALASYYFGRVAAWRVGGGAGESESGAPTIPGS